MCTPLDVTLFHLSRNDLFPLVLKNELVELGNQVSDRAARVRHPEHVESKASLHSVT